MLTQAAFLTFTSYPLRTSPVKRGKWVLEVLLDDPPPPPLPGADSLSTEAKAVEGKSLRMQLESHRSRKECASCHTLEKGMHNVGPTLAGLFQRKAGSFDDFRYSPAMKRANITWTAEELDKFIADPQVVVPANRMPYAGMTNAADRADLIAYLQKAAQ